MFLARSCGQGSGNNDSERGDLSDPYLDYFTFPSPEGDCSALMSFLPRVLSVPSDSQDEAYEVE